MRINDIDGVATFEYLNKHGETEGVEWQADRKGRFDIFDYDGSVEFYVENTPHLIEALQACFEHASKYKENNIE